VFPEVDHAEGPLTHARVISGSLHQEESAALLEAAGNLLTKAATRLAGGDETAARKLAERALHLPFDDFEEVHPASWWLELEMSSRLTEEVELAAEGDSRWLVRVETLLGELSGTAASVVRGGLHDVLSEFPLPRDEESRVHRLIDDEPFGREPLSEVEDAAKLTEATLAVLRALNRQSDLYAQDLHTDT
jgi:hypothetical protein